MFLLINSVAAIWFALILVRVIMMQPSTHTISRITTLWAITECGLGGFFHAIQSPFTGLLVGGLSVIYICLIVYHSASKVRDLAQALFFVLLVKFVVSPHSPPGAYLAVSMQCLFGMFFFTVIPHHKTAALFTAIASLVSSALQKVIILTIIFGMPLWEALDKFVKVVVGFMDFVTLPESFSASLWLVSVFVGIYFIGGIMVGWMAGALPSLLMKRRSELAEITSSFQLTHVPVFSPTGKRSFMMPLLVVAMMALVFVFDYMFISSETAVYQLLRTMLVIGAWMLVFNPLMRFVLGRYFRGKQAAYENQVERVRESLPRMSAFARFAWKRSRTMQGRWRLLNFVVLFIYFGMYEA